MLYWALIFLVVAIIAGALGFGGIAGASVGIAQILFFIPGLPGHIAFGRPDTKSRLSGVVEVPL